ncbi:hypothetical protein [Virgibacillus ndiopensis]|uniref:hypothetical protein n=1 Tax=Virgibacillus ndiopensis TaxID=2004408 RepID=UPI000C06AA9D|nr:hypothetical protein [Virgibacillus ndiopensis]
MENIKDGLYYHIGTLNYDGHFYTFEYTFRSESPRTVKEAIHKGYHLHPVFPVLEKTYKSEKLFPAFDRRIPGKSRVGYEKILEEFNLPAYADRMDMLRMTRGMLSQDQYSFEEPLRLNGNQLWSNFYVNGMRHRTELPKNCSELIHEGEPLIPELEEVMNMIHTL